MARRVDFSIGFTKAFSKLERRNPVMRSAIAKKLAEIIEQPEHYKPLRGELHGFRRVHFGSYVLKFKVTSDSVLVLELEHHDDAYR